MQPVNITIDGNYYDCQIYRGRLYLWTFDGVLKVYDWNELVQSFIKKDTDKIAMTFCFLDGTYLYKSSLIELFKDDDFKKLLLKKFAVVEKANFHLSEKQLAKFLFGQQDTPTGILPTDTEIYSNRLYFIHEKGLFSGSAHRRKSDKFPVNSKPSKLWDCNLLSIKANKYPQLALSGGNEGLFELNMAKCLPSNLERVEKTSPIFQVSKEHSSFSNYLSLDIYNTSLVENSFLARFKWEKTQDEELQRNFNTSVTMFKVKGKKHFLSWGVEDKMYKVTDSGFEIINYSKTDEFTEPKSVDLYDWNERIINGGTAYFGNIVECENTLVIIKSDSKPFNIQGPITRWRVYPRSKNYENHLHVILDNEIKIYSFNHDYFLNQEEKEIGIQFKFQNINVKKFNHQNRNRFDFDSHKELQDLRGEKTNPLFFIEPVLGHSVDVVSDPPRPDIDSDIPF